MLHSRWQPDMKHPDDVPQQRLSPCMLLNAGPPNHTRAGAAAQPEKATATIPGTAIGGEPSQTGVVFHHCAVRKVTASPPQLSKRHCFAANLNE